MRDGSQTVVAREYTTVASSGKSNRLTQCIEHAADGSEQEEPW